MESHPPALAPLSPTQPAAGAPPIEPSKAALALGLAIASWFLCGVLTSIPAVVIAHREQVAIAAGRRDPLHARKARIAYRIGVANLLAAPVLVILALAGALVTPTFIARSERSHLVRGLGEVNTMGMAFARMRTDLGPSAPVDCLTIANLASRSPPACMPGLSRCDQVSDGSACWGGPYVAARTDLDPWGRAYGVDVDPETRAIRISSPGSDGLDGTADDLTKVF